MIPSNTNYILNGLIKNLTHLQASTSSIELHRADWERGDLSYKYWDVQRKMAQNLNSDSRDIKLLNCSRRIRKTSTAVSEAIGYGLRNKQSLIRFASPTQRMMRNILIPIVNMTCLDAPLEYKPIWKGSESKYYFPSSSSELHIAGCNNGHEDDLVGQTAHLCIVDEAQLINKLKHVIDVVLMPQLISTDGQLWVLMTPPKTPIHECMKYVKEAKVNGTYSEYNIHESEYPKDRIAKFCKKAGGEFSTTWQSQYNCQLIVDKNFQIIPEWNNINARDVIHTEFTKYFHRYVGLDIGVRDLTAALFGYYDFPNAQLVIEDEITINGPTMTTDKLKDLIVNKEKELSWTKQQTIRRIGDNSHPLLLQDLGQLHQLYFQAVTKSTLDAMVNKVRLMVKDNRIIVAPKCKHLLGCLEYAVWNDKRNAFEHDTRNDEDNEDEILLSLGHFDHLAALIYLVISMDTRTNPIPRDIAYRRNENYFIPLTEIIEDTHNTSAIRKIFSKR